MRALLRRNRGLVLLNLALLTGVVLAGLDRPAGAQNAAPPAGQSVARGRGDFTMVSGKVSTGGSDVIYVIDVANQDLVALRWDTGKQSLVGVGYRDFAADAKVLPGR